MRQYPNTPTSWWQRVEDAYWNLPGGKRIGALAVLGVSVFVMGCLLVSLCSSLLVARQSTDLGAQVPTVPPTADTATATPTLPATPAAAPIPLSSTVLGGGAIAFFNRYGIRSIVDGGPPQYYRAATYQITASGGTTVRLEVDNDDQTGRVPQMILTPPDWQVTSWSAQTTNTVVGPYLPRDSKYIKELPAGDGVFDIGTKRIYQSAALGASFDASVFSDGTNLLPPGTFSVTCEHYTKAPEQGTDICYLNLGISDN